MEKDSKWAKESSDQATFLCQKPYKNSKLFGVGSCKQEQCAWRAKALERLNKSSGDAMKGCAGLAFLYHWIDCH